MQNLSYETVSVPLRDTTADEKLSSAEYRGAMRQVAFSVAIVTSKHGEVFNGLTATAVSSVSAEPPKLLVCVNNDASAKTLIDQSGILAVNFLNEDQANIARAFSTAKLPGAQRFSSGSWLSLISGAPVLSEAAAVFDCRVEQHIAESTHAIFICKVLAVRSSKNSALLYRNGDFCGLADVRRKGED